MRIRAITVLLNAASWLLQREVKLVVRRIEHLEYALDNTYERYAVATNLQNKLNALAKCEDGE